MHDDVEEGQPSLENIMSEPRFEIAEERDSALEEGPKLEGMDISQIVKMREERRLWVWLQ